MKAWLLALLAFVCVQHHAVVAAAQPAGTACKQQRIRKPWEAYTQDDKDLYVKAVGLAMERGYHQKFVELHTETNSEAEAHRNCLFMYWHRMFLLGYENMLRSLGPEYACVTLPYWDHLSATARTASGTCSSIEECSPIYTGLGGSTTGVDKDLRIYTTTIPDTTATTCVTNAPLSSFCGNNTQCAGCVLRGSASTTEYPAEATFASVYQQVFTYSDWPSFALSIERGVHNMVHNALGGIMVYFQSPIDPVFYTHHGVIDLLQTLYLKCQLGSERAKLTAAQKGSDSRVWSNCPRRSGVRFRNTDTITMMTRDYNGKWVHVRTSPNNMLYPFFKDVPGRFADYVDAKDLGVYSYTYQMQGALANMFTNCKDANTVNAAVLLSDEALAARDVNANKSDLRPILNGPTATDTKFRLWTIAVYESAKLAGYTSQAARDQMELILCYHSDECLGGVADYSDLFRNNFGVTGHPRCFTLLEQLKAGKKIIGVPEWHEISSRFLSCPKPKSNADGTLHHHHADDATTHEDGTKKVSMESMLAEGPPYSLERNPLASLTSAKCSVTSADRGVISSVVEKATQSNPLVMGYFYRSSSLAMVSTALFAAVETMHLGTTAAFPTRPTLFILAIDVPDELIGADPRLPGLALYQHTNVSIVGFADDTTTYLGSTAKAPAFLQILVDFATASNLSQRL